MSALDFQNKLTYLRQIKAAFPPPSSTYDSVVEALCALKVEGRNDQAVTIERACDLLRGHSALIEGMNSFLPAGYQLEHLPGLLGGAADIIRLTTPTGTKAIVHEADTGPSVARSSPALKINGDASILDGKARALLQDDDGGVRGRVEAAPRQAPWNAEAGPSAPSRTGSMTHTAPTGSSTSRRAPPFAFMVPSSTITSIRKQEYTDLSSLVPAVVHKLAFENQVGPRDVLDIQQDGLSSHEIELPFDIYGAVLDYYIALMRHLGVNADDVKAMIRLNEYILRHPRRASQQRALIGFHAYHRRAWVDSDRSFALDDPDERQLDEVIFTLSQESARQEEASEEEAMDDNEAVAEEAEGSAKASGKRKADADLPPGDRAAKAARIAEAEKNPDPRETTTTDEPESRAPLRVTAAQGPEILLQGRYFPVRKLRIAWVSANSKVSRTKRTIQDVVRLAEKHGIPSGGVVGRKTTHALLDVDLPQERIDALQIPILSDADVDVLVKVLSEAGPNDLIPAAAAPPPTVAASQVTATGAVAAAAPEPAAGPSIQGSGVQAQPSTRSSAYASPSIAQPPGFAALSAYFQSQPAESRVPAKAVPPSESGPKFEVKHET